MKKGIGEKVLGWFIVAEDDEATERSQEDPRVEDERSGEPEVKDPSTPVGNSVEGSSRTAMATTPGTARGSRPPVVVPGHVHDARAFAEVYRAAGLPKDDHERLAKVLDLLASLPNEAAPDVKRSIVGAALHAFG